jgi:DNA-directed RNA polymerase subunit RPC12/RpoP
MYLPSIGKTKTAKSERITQYEGDLWRCLCGNIAESDGFYPCNETGREVEPTAEEWQTNAYVCARCGRIINMYSLEVIGVRTRYENLRVLLEYILVSIKIFLRQMRRRHLRP